jgi:hypothetical protein
MLIANRFECDCIFKILQSHNYDFQSETTYTPACKLGFGKTIIDEGGNPSIFSQLTSDTCENCEYYTKEKPKCPIDDSHTVKFIGGTSKSFWCIDCQKILFKIK